MKISRSSTYAVAFLVAIQASSAMANVPSPSERIALTIRRELHVSKGRTFFSLLKKWDDRYGPAAVSPLLQVASDLELEDQERYAALMGAAKLGGSAASPLVARFLKDRSWMLRSGALRALSALQSRQVASSVLPLLEDPALVVRAEAVTAVEKLRPEGSVPALLRAIQDPRNYHARKAQWVPQRALSALKAFRAREAVPKLRPLLDRQDDPELQAHAVDTIASLIGKDFAAKTPLPQKVRQLKLALAK